MSTDWTLLAEADSFTGVHICDGKHINGCRACRWFEVRLSRSDSEYKVEMVGHSKIPGEETRIRVEQTTSPHAVIDFLTMGEPGKRYIPKISRAALHEAGDIDQGLADALDDFDNMAGVL